MTRKIDGFTAIEVVIVILILCIVSVAGFTVYEVQQTKTYSNSCFIIDVPKDYSAVSNVGTCQFAAYTGAKNSPTSEVFLSPILKPTTASEAEAGMKATHPDIPLSRVSINGYSAIEQIGLSNGHGLNTYVVLSPKTYSGADGKIYGFLITVLYPETKTSFVKNTIDSIRWK